VTVRSIRRAAVALVALTALTGALAACTKSNGPKTVGTSTIVQTITHSAPPVNGKPVSTGAVTAKTVSSCPYLSLGSAKDNAGMRLDKITELIQDGKSVGCRFYPLAHPNAQCGESCFLGEKLPPGSQIAVEFQATKYASATAATNAFIILSRSGTNVQQEKITSSNTGLCFQINFYPHDKGKDWACAFSKGTTEVVIKTVVTDPAQNVVQIAQAIEPKF
jgi:hypothetical protein